MQQSVDKTKTFVGILVGNAKLGSGTKTDHTLESIQCTALPLTQMGMVSRMSGVLCMPACLRCTWPQEERDVSWPEVLRMAMQAVWHAITGRRWNDTQGAKTTHLIKKSAVVDVAPQLRKLVLQNLLKFKAAGLHACVTRAAAHACAKWRAQPVLSSPRSDRNKHRLAGSRLYCGEGAHH